MKLTILGTYKLLGEQFSTVALMSVMLITKNFLKCIDKKLGVGFYDPLPTNL